MSTVRVADQVQKHVLTDEAIDKIKAMIVADELAPGSRLPKEETLAGQLGLSRNSLRDFSQVVGDRAFDTVDYVEQDWTAEQWTQGGPTSVADPGVLSDFGQWMGRAFGRVRWAGAEFSRTGTASWTAPSAPASTPPPKSWVGTERNRHRPTDQRHQAPGTEHRAAAVSKLATPTGQDRTGTP